MERGYIISMDSEFVGTDNKLLKIITAFEHARCSQCMIICISTQVLRIIKNLCVTILALLFIFIWTCNIAFMRLFWKYNIPETLINDCCKLYSMILLNSANVDQLILNINLTLKNWI